MFLAATTQQWFIIQVPENHINWHVLTCKFDDVRKSRHQIFNRGTYSDFNIWCPRQGVSMCWRMVYHWPSEIICIVLDTKNIYIKQKLGQFWERISGKNQSSIILLIFTLTSLSRFPSVAQRRHNERVISQCVCFPMHTNPCQHLHYRFDGTR